MEAKLFVFAAVAISEVFSACSPTGTKFKNFQKTPKRSIRFKIGVVSKKCPGLDEFYYRWTVQEVPTYKTLRSTTESWLTIDGYTFPSSKCYIVRYLVTVKVSHYPDMSYANEAKDTFRFIPDQMHIDILGGYEKTHPYGEDLILDAKTLSSDPSYLAHEDPFAKNFIRWSIPAEFRNFRPPRRLIIIVPAKYFRNHIIYKFTVTVSRTKIPQFRAVARATQIVTILKGKFPQLNIICLRNCIYPHPMEITVFAVNCTRNCKNLDYKWYVEPAVKDRDKIDFGDEHDKLIILNNAYEIGDKLKVNVKSYPSAYSIKFDFTQGLVEGKCNINPKEGISGVTKFKVNCTGFDSPYGIVIYNIYQRSGPEYLLINEDNYYDDSELYLAPAEEGEIVVEVLDNAYLNAYTWMNVSVKEFKPQENIELLSAVKELVLATDQKSVTSFSIEGYNNEIVQLIIAMLQTIEDIEVDEVTARDLHKHMVEALLRIHPPKFAVAYQVMQVLLKLEFYRTHEDTVTAELMVRAMAHASVHVHLMFNHGYDRHIPQTYIENFMFQTLNLISSILKISENIFDILNKTAPYHYYDSYDEYVSRKVQIRDDFRQMMSSVLIAIQTNCITTLHKAFPDEKVRIYDNGNLSLATQRKLIISPSMFILRLSKTTIDAVLIPQDLLEELSSVNYFIDLQGGLFRWNPFWWDINAKAVNTRIVVFSLFFGCRKVKKIKTSFFIQFEVLSLPKQVKKGTLTDRNIAVYKIKLEGHQNLIIRFDNVPGSYAPYNVTWADCFCGEKDFQSPRTINIQKNSTSTKIVRIQNNLTTSIVIFVCIKKLTQKLSYQMTFTSFACIYWDLNSYKLSKDGCRVVKAGLEDSEPLICECSHFSLFAGHIAIPPTTLTLHDDINFAIQFAGNYSMTFIVLGILALYVILLLFAHYKDKTFEKKNVIHKLDDNVPGDPYAYLVVFFTGFYFDATTTADIGFQLMGEQANSRTHVVKCEGFKLLQRNTQDWFTIYCPFYLGHLKKLKLWTNCKGKYPHWYCERVIVQDLKTGTQYCFTVEKWFSLTWGTKKIYREIRFRPPESEDPNALFLTHLESEMRDKHIWLSITVRDFQSNFNSKERVSAGFVFLFLAMFYNVLFYGESLGAPLDAIDQDSKYYFDVTQLVRFFGSWLTAFTIVLFIMFFFKNSSPL